MSQSGLVAITSGILPPSVPLQFTADDATTAVPAANNLNVFSIENTANNDNGVRTTASGSTMTVQLTNRKTATVTTSDATPTVIMTFALGATPGIYYFEGNLVAHDVTDTSGGVYTFVSGFRTSDFSISASANNFVITVTGIAAKTINWNSFLTYRFVS